MRRPPEILQEQRKARVHVGAHEHLFVYRKAMEAARACEAVARLLAPLRPDLADQLRRAADSVVLNIAEGAAEWLVREKLRYYRIARRSAGECEAAIELAELTLGRSEATQAAGAAMKQVFALLVRTARAIEER